MNTPPVINRYRAQRKNRAPTRMEVARDGRSATYHRPGGYTRFEMDGDMLTWATSEVWSHTFLDRLGLERNLERRAPLGDSHGAWQKIATIPINLLADQVPMAAWEDTKAINRVLNDSDNRAWRTDGNHRKV